MGGGEPLGARSNALFVPAATASIDLEGRLSARVCVSSCDGNASLIEAPGTGGSCVKDDADERSDRKLSVRVTDRNEGSELAEETEGDSVPASDIGGYCGGV